VNSSRRLVAIVCVDMVGYSRLVAADEDGTLARWKAVRIEVIDPKLAQANGRVVKTTGDGLLIEFESIVAAMRFAIGVQTRMSERDDALPPDCRIQFRIGIHQGDVVIDGGDILGDAVNVASRLEGLAEPGGICVSARVQEDATGKLDVIFDDIGEQKLKNIQRPMRVFRARPADIADPLPAGRVSRALADDGKEREDAIYTEYLTEWARRCDLDGWADWSSGIFGAETSIDVEADARLMELQRWLLTRVWPGRYPELEKAFLNFSCVLNDFRTVFFEHAETTRSGETWCTPRFYKIPEWNEPLYQHLLNVYNYHTMLVADIFLELTRSANLICEAGRHSFLSDFRMREGWVGVMTGTYPHGMSIVRYRDEQVMADKPYPGLEGFKIDRAARDLNFGTGNPPPDLPPEDPNPDDEIPF
jgi:class 3 adenylate cyclase